MTFSEKLIYLRAKLNLTQKDLAELLNVSFATINRWESGKVAPTKKALINFKILCDDRNIIFPNDKILRVFEGFAGYGGGSFALKRISKTHTNFKYDVVGYSEIDKHACDLYDANHRDKNGQLITNFGDITKIDPHSPSFPDFDIFMGGFPCQPFSTAGMQKGEDDPYGRGTLFQHIIRICAVKKPRYILMENVKGILSKKFDKTRELMCDLLREIGYVRNKNNPNESPLAMVVLNSKDYGIPQNRERVWMFARFGGLPDGFSMKPEEKRNELKMADFLDPEGYVPKEMYLSQKQIEHLKVKHNIPSFFVETPLCLDIYNKKIKYDGYSITITLPEHNSLRVIEAHKDKEVVRKMSATEQFRLMGLEGLKGVGRQVDIDFAGQSYTQLSRRAGNGWDVNLVTILLNHIFSQLKDIDSDLFAYEEDLK